MPVFSDIMQDGALSNIYSQFEETQNYNRTIDEKELATISLKNDVQNQKTEQPKEEVIEIDDKEEEKKDTEVKDENPKTEEKLESQDTKTETKELPQLVVEEKIPETPIQSASTEVLIKKSEPVITPNDIVEEITELTNPQAEGNKRKKNPNKKSTKKKEEIKVDKITEDNPFKIKLKREDGEDKNEEDDNVCLVDELKIRIEKGNDVMKVKINDEAQEQ